MNRPPTRPAGADDFRPGMRIPPDVGHHRVERPNREQGVAERGPEHPHNECLGIVPVVGQVD
ncbi:MAG TPA: hypothetical protein VKD71_02815 [Gemmataceae bacterium]|nr:hypothetical protein [Gemmataceae bacterium]